MTGAKSRARVLVDESSACRSDAHNQVRDGALGSECRYRELTVTLLALRSALGEPMPLVDMTLKLSEEIAVGLADGRYELFGSVLRDNSGRVVKMLKPVVRHSALAARSNPKLALAAIAAGAVAGAAIYVGSRFTRKARLARRLANVDFAIKSAVSEHATELTRDDLYRIRDSINEFLELADSESYPDATVVLTDDARRLLLGFAEALRSFSAELNRLSASSEPAPNLAVGDNTELVPLLKVICGQLDYQERNWPTSR